MTLHTIPPSRAAEIALYINERLGLPWEGDGLHCWALAQQTVRDLFGRELPIVASAPCGRRTKAQLINGHSELGKWIETPSPGPWAVALMHRRGAPPDLLEHAGVYLAIEGGHVFHVDEGHGVVFDSIWELPLIRAWARPRLFIPRA